jgi:hypothetical protein
VSERELLIGGHADEEEVFVLPARELCISATLWYKSPQDLPQRSSVNLAVGEVYKENPPGLTVYHWTQLFD